MMKRMLHIEVDPILEAKDRIWASPQENLLGGFANNTGADQPGPSVQSDQSLCYSLVAKYHI